MQMPDGRNGFWLLRPSNFSPLTVVELAGASLAEVRFLRPERERLDSRERSPLVLRNSPERRRFALVLQALSPGQPALPS
jgi:hypothetical protein